MNEPGYSDGQPIYLSSNGHILANLDAHLIGIIKASKLLGILAMTDKERWENDGRELRALVERLEKWVKVI